MDAFAEAFASAWRETENPFPPERLVDFVVDKPASLNIQVPMPMDLNAMKTVIIIFLLAA
jgi:hypothetical protein